MRSAAEGNDPIGIQIHLSIYPQSAMPEGDLDSSLTSYH